MRCVDLMRRPVEFAIPGQSVTAAARKMRDANIGFLPVCDADGKVVGALTDRDIAIRACASDRAGTATVGEVMTPEVISCHPTDELGRVEELMAKYHKARILVTDGDGKLAGVISLADVASADESGAAGTLRAVAGRELLDGQGRKPDGRSEVRRALDEVKRLRDEIRVRIHLAGMDAKKAWRKLEPQIDKLDRQLDAAGARVSAELEGAIEQARKSITALRERL
jgi:CBS domain-containing protein